MLDDFLIANHDAIVASARARVAARTCPQPRDLERCHGVPVFLEQLGHALRLARATSLVDHEKIEESATRHGHDLWRLGLTIGQVVHDYGDVCQAITALAMQQGAAISTEEFRTLNLCLDDAIAGAVTEYAHQRELAHACVGRERLGLLAHDLRSALDTATLAFASIQSGRVTGGGSTALVLGRSLLRLRDLVDGSLLEVRLSTGSSHDEAFSVAGLVEELEIGAFVQAQARGLHFAARAVDGTALLRGDRQIVVAAVAHLLDNAFKLTRKHTGVTLVVRVVGDRVLFDVEDACGGPPPAESAAPVAPGGGDHGGLGLPFAICQTAAVAHGGELRVRVVPGKSCVFTFSLPRYVPPESPTPTAIVAS